VTETTDPLRPGWLDSRTPVQVAVVRRRQRLLRK